MKRNHEYPTDVIKAVQEYLYENENRIVSDYEVRGMENYVVLHYYLMWEGIIGYTGKIVTIMTR